MKLDVTRKGYYEIWIEGNIEKSTQHSSITEALASGLEFKYNNLDKKVTLKQPNLEFEVDLDDSADIELLKLKIEELESKEIMYLQEIERLKGLNNEIDIVIPEEVRAFPSAYGAGSETTGGRGGTVIHVTNLLWNDTQGSFKWALEQDYPRIIVFDVSGVIDITGIGLYYGAKGDVTIAGQTAPEGGITIRGEQIGFFGEDNVIIRYLKFRKPGSTPVYDWCLNVADATNVIIDRCSFSFSEEYALGVGTNNTNYGGDVTIQNNLFAECKDAVLVGNSDLINTDIGSYSVLNNAYINVGWRVPAKFGGALEIDIINNAVHNWWGRTIRADSDDYTVNIIENYFQTGSNTRATDNPEIMFTTHTSTTMNPRIWDENNTWTVFDVGNPQEYDPKPVGYPADKSLAWDPFATSTDPIKSEWFVNTRLPIQGRAITILPNANLKTYLIDKVGATKYIDDNGNVQTYVDPLDTKFLNDFNNEIDVNYTTNWSNPLPTMPTNTRPANFYVSNPHIPEVWFSANVPNGEDETYIMPSGYPAIEEYLNQVDSI